MALSRFNANPFFFGFDDFFAPTPFFHNKNYRDPFDDWMPVIRNIDRSLAAGGDNMILRRSSPGYEINESDDTYSISMDIPGVKSSDISAQLENNGRVLHVSGGRKMERDGTVTETKFEKRFTIGENVDTKKLTADLSDGVLTVSAPKLVKKEAEPMKIAITEHKAIEEKKEG